MPRYYCYYCHKVWSSGGSDFKVIVSMCPEHTRIRCEEVVRQQEAFKKPPGVWRAQQMKGGDSSR